MSTLHDAERLTEVACRLNAVRVLASARARAQLAIEPDEILDGIEKIAMTAALHLAVLREWAA